MWVSLRKWTITVNRGISTGNLQWTHLNPKCQLAIMGNQALV